MYHVPEKFGLTNLRNLESMAALMPPEVAAEAHLFQRDYDVDGGETVDWAPVEQAVERWAELHDNLERLRTFTDRPFYYTDGGTFLEIVDRRDEFRLITLEELWRQIYLHCMEIRGVAGVIQRFASVEGEAKVHEILDALCEERLMYREGKRCLSLAPAVHPTVAARRIRRAHVSD